MVAAVAGCRLAVAVDVLTDMVLATVVALVAVTVVALVVVTVAALVAATVVDMQLANSTVSTSHLDRDQ